LNLDHDEPLNVLLIVNFIFSVSTTQIFSALLNGHTLFIAENDILDKSNYLTDYINNNQLIIFKRHLQFLIVWIYQKFVL
ncbi:hypothetical protein, partial [Streptococcus anginosus]|uniref:hypothetical protein n=1 Tax=Streptococcus anginosus TaxID=1328 RepID=UPI001CD31D60